MRLVTFKSAGRERVGAITSGGVLDLRDAAARLGRQLPLTMQGLIDAGPVAWDLARTLIERCPMEAMRYHVDLRAPLPRPARLRDVSLFLEHMEAGLAKLGRVMSPEFKRQTIYYNADHAHVYGPGDDIAWPRNSHWMDYELEWACIIGRGGSNISRSNAMSHIFGFTVFNDWSARDLQFPFMEANLGPAGGKDFANSLGPCIVTPDELPNLYALRMSATINGEPWSLGTTASMHHKWEDAVEQLSVDRPLLAGEIFGSGTVLDGCGFELDRRLSFGDVVELEVEGIGVLRNRVVAPTALPT